MRTGLFPLSHRPFHCWVADLGQFTLDTAANSTEVEFAVSGSEEIVNVWMTMRCLEDDQNHFAGEEIPIAQLVYDNVTNLDGRPTWHIRWNNQTVKVIVFHTGSRAKLIDPGDSVGSPAAMTKTAWAFRVYALTKSR